MQKYEEVDDFRINDASVCLVSDSEAESSVIDSKTSRQARLFRCSRNLNSRTFDTVPLSARQVLKAWMVAHKGLREIKI